MSEILLPGEAWVEIVKKGAAYDPAGLAGENLNVTTDIKQYTESGLEKETETEVFFHNSRVTIKKPQSDGEVSFNVKVTRALWNQALDGATGSDFVNTSTQDDYRITLCITKDPSVTHASAALGSGFDHYRRIYADCNMVSFSPTLEAEGYLEGEATFRLPAFDENGSANVRTQTDPENLPGFPAVGSYTASSKWD